MRRARRALPGDPDFGDPLSAAALAARAPPHGRPTGCWSVTPHPAKSASPRLQVWQALTERVSGKPANREVTLVFTDLVGFSSWSLSAGDDATLKLLAPGRPGRRAAAAGGGRPHRQADGRRHHGGVRRTRHRGARRRIAARDAVKAVEVDGYTPRMRVGIHTGRPQRIGSDWLGRRRQHRRAGDGAGHTGAGWSFPGPRWNGFPKTTSKRSA